MLIPISEKRAREIFEELWKEKTRNWIFNVYPVDPLPVPIPVPTEPLPTQTNKVPVIGNPKPNRDETDFRWA